MSGIEVAGLVLGVLPILLKVVDSSKDGMRRTGLVFRKRKYIEKLSHALLLQQQILEETLKSVLIACDCKDVYRLEDDPLQLLRDDDLREDILDLLGPKNDAAFTTTIEQSNHIVTKIARDIAGLVPTANKDATNNLMEIIDANKDTGGLRADLSSRAKLVFKTTDFKDAIRELDKTTNTLDRFTRVLLSNRQTFEEKASKRAVKLAKALRNVRKSASSLSSAILKSWRDECHSKHDAKLLLEDRVEDTSRRATPYKDISASPAFAFQLILTATINQYQSQWHETIVQVYNEEDNEVCALSSTDQPERVSGVRIIVPEQQAHAKADVNLVDDICSFIEAAKHDKRQVEFVLTENRKIGAIDSGNNNLVAYQAETVTLKSLLQSSDGSGCRRMILPLKIRMLLALRLASNLLQLLQTQWLQTALSKDVVCFMLRSIVGGAGETAQDQPRIDLSRPFVSLTFDRNVAQDTRSMLNVGAKVALLELGILLLEIWHETTLETHFSLPEAPNTYYKRLPFAVEWLDDTDNPLPDMYEQAVSYCIQRAIGGEMHLSGEGDFKIWSAFCENVIDPLYKICKQWH